MKDKKNEFWKLDLLETKFTKSTPRFSFTKKLINAKNNSHITKKLPTSRQEAFEQIEALKSDLFHKKFYGSNKKLKRDVSRIVKQQQRTWPSSHDHLKELFSRVEFLDLLITSKLVKLIQSGILTTPALKTTPPTYIPLEILTILSDKADPRNPSHFFKTYCQDDKLVNGYISQMWNSKEIKPLCEEIQWTFKKIRGNFTPQELKAHESTKTKEKIPIDSDSDSDSGSDSDDDLSKYDGMVGGSGSDSDSNSDDSDADSNSDADSISSSHSDPKPSKSKEKIHSLPSLNTGYFSGGSDDEDDVDNDKIVKEATTVRKNRRGQRARQKIWEQKYGTKANHVQKENQRLVSERETRQREFEERQRKRELKAQAQEASGTSSSTQKVHPSWVAKKNAEDKLKNVKFSGKKITFD